VYMYVYLYFGRRKIGVWRLEDWGRDGKWLKMWGAGEILLVQNRRLLNGRFVVKANACSNFKDTCFPNLGFCL